MLVIRSVEFGPIRTNSHEMEEDHHPNWNPDIYKTTAHQPSAMN
jgi:hypothetical protein